MESRTSSRSVLHLFSAALTAAVLFSPFTAFCQVARQPDPATTSAKIDLRVTARAQSAATVAVFIVLKNQPQASIFQQVEAASALSQEIADSRYQMLAAQAVPGPDELSRAQAAADAVTLDTRRRAFQAIEQAIRPEQDALESRLIGWGASRIWRYTGINMLTAEIPASAIQALEADSSIAEVAPVEVLHADLATSVPALGAPAFWTAGFTGQGQAVGVLDTGVRTNHPAFAGKSIVSQVFLTYGSADSCFDDNANSGEDQNGHGTHVAGIVASQGSSGWTNYQGVAKGISTLYNLKIGFNLSPSCDGGAESYSSDVLAAIDWAVRNTSLKVLNYSYGGTAVGDDDAFTRSIDQYADTYGLTIAIAAGNSGPGNRTVESPGIAYNSITTANWVSRGTIASSSSRGPTSSGRYKPDLAAPGTVIYSTAYDWDASGGTGDDFVAMTGTSMATPHMAGSAALLRSAGVTNALAVKALLVNSADDTAWASDSGWGYANLTRAQQELYYATGSLAAGDFQLYKVTPAGAFTASVVWNRHVSGSTSNFNNIDLYLCRSDTGAQLAASTTTIQDVEQVSAGYSGDAIVTVDMASTTLKGTSSEPYGIAFSNAASAVAGPALTPSCSLPSSIPSGSQFTMSCGATNSGDLTAFGVTGQATLPAGFSGGNQVSLGNIAAGHSSSSGLLTLTAPTSAGTYPIPFTITSNSYGVAFTGTASYNANVQAALPAPVLISPANGATGVASAPTLSWNASTGATSYDVYLSTAASPAFVANVTTTSYSAGTLNGGTLYYWRVVAKKASGASGSATWSFTTQVAAPPAPVLTAPSNGASGVSQSPTLRWNASSGATSYDVYFGTASSPPLATNTVSVSYSPGTLSAGTVYYWCVVAKNTGGSNTSSTWSFTTLTTGPPAPVLSSPSNGATAVSQTPTLSWGAAAGATSYDVYLGTSVSPPLVKNTTATSYSPSSLNAATLYYWRVVAKNSGGSTSSATWSFTTQVAAPAVPVLTAPANGAGGILVTTALTWSASAGASSYDVYLGTSSSPPLVKNTTATAYAPGNLAAGTLYYWRVVAKNAGGTASSVTWSFTTLVPPPAAPAPTAPGNGTPDVSLSPTLTWSASIGAATYDVYFGTVSPPPLVTNTTGTTYSPANLEGSTTYYWQVVAKNPGGSNASATWSFTTQAAAPKLVAPPNGAIEVPVSTSLSWGAVAGATSYDVYLGTQASPPLVGNTTVLTYTPAALTSGTLYFWRVVVKDTGVSSPTWSFTTPMTQQPHTALRFVPIQPCRIADTRSPESPFGGPSLGGGTLRAFAVPQSACGIPATAQAYSLNVTVVPYGRLSYLTLWPAGQVQPGVSTLNSWSGAVVANAAIVPAGAGGAVNVFVTDPTDVILDINGYFDSAAGANAYSFYPATPCRVADTRNPDGPFGGPSMQSSEARDFTIPSSPCGLPASAKAYSLNVTVVPDPIVHYLGFLTTWAAGQAKPGVSTLNSWNGKVVANAAIVPAGANGAVSVFVTDPTDVILDTNGYFAAPGGAGALSFYPVPPCRVADTRGADGPLGGPIMAAQTARAFPIPSSACGIPAAAAAYSMNVTVVPDGVLSYLTAWPTGASQPNVSTLNSFDGSVVANAAIVPAGTAGAISVFVTDRTHVILDVNGYFAQ